MRRPPSIWFATATFIATIVGAGIFGLPFVASRSGFVIFLVELVVLAVVIHIVDLLYAEVVWKTPGRERFLGYVDHFFGRRVRHLVAPITIASFYGALLAYLIIGGTFLHNIFGGMFGGTPTAYSVVLFIIGGLAVWRGLAVIERADFVLVAIVMLIVAVLVAVGLPHVKMENLATFNFSSALLPYGAILFALSGLSIIPELRELAGTPVAFRRSLRIGIILAAGLYAFFALTVVGVSGTRTSSDAIEGLRSPIGAGVVRLGSILGALTIFGAFTSLGVSLKRIFTFDYRIPYPFSTFFAVLPPLLLFALGIQNFSTVINFIGAVVLGITIAVTILLYRKSRAHTELPGILLRQPPLWLVDGLLVLFLLGVVVELVRTVVG